MTRIRIAVLGLSLLGLWFASGLPGAAETIKEREGVTDLPAAELRSAIADMAHDARYVALSGIAADHGLKLDPGKAVGKQFPEGYSAIFVPVMDQDGHERGLLITSDNVWSLGFTVQDGKATVPEGFIAKNNEKGEVTLEASRMTSSEEIAEPENATLASVWTGCSYVRNTGFSWGCYSPGNFGQYYVPISRWGYDPNPYTVAWRACYMGAIHVCPLYEAPGSPFAWVVCGAPPRHPIG